MTVKQSKLAISIFNFQPFLIFDGTSTVLFGHKAAEENAFLEEEDIYMDTEWAYSNNKADNSLPEFPLPGWGSLQRPYSETELREGRI